MKVSVDLAICENQAVCIGLAPAVFDFNDDDQLIVLQPEPSEDLRQSVEEAAAACPVGAILIDDDPQD
jgi:ferredoxin